MSINIKNILRIPFRSDNDLKEFSILIDQVPDLNKDTNMPLLFYAVKYQSIPVVDLLLEKGANIDITDSSGSTAISIAASLGKYNMVKFLLKKDADPSIKDKYGYTPLYFVVDFMTNDLSENLRDRYYQTLKILLSNKKINVNTVTDENLTPLMIAAEKNNLTVVNDLLHANANPFMKDHMGRTAYDITTDPQIKLLIKRYKTGENEELQKLIVAAAISGKTKQRINPAIAKKISVMFFRNKSLRKSKRKSLRKSKRKSLRKGKRKSLRKSKRKSLRKSKRK
jgi:hypothetical protein